MKDQYWYCLHVKADQGKTQVTEEDERIKGFLTGLHFRSPGQFLGMMTECYSGMTSNHSAMFLNVSVANEYVNLPKTKKVRMSFYGVAGRVKVARDTRYVNYYISEEKTLLGRDFFSYIFDSFYLSDEEAADTSENITTLLDKKVAVDKKKDSHIEIKEKDRDLVCRIVERLWSSQIEDTGARLVLCINEEEIQSRSEELLKQIYLLLPQKLRMNMGFCTNSNPKDIAYLSGECGGKDKLGLPVHIFTMKVEDIEKTKQEFAATEFKYPVVLFDVENPEKEVCDPQRLKLIEELSYKLSPTSDAKIAYAEKRVLQEEHSTQVSFTNLQKIFEKLNSKGFCWWERDDLESIEDIFRSYQDQQEMMDNEVLKKEAIDTFYQKLLPWKEYARQLADVVLNEQYENREEILPFFATELQYAKILDSLEYVRKNVADEAAAHEQMILEEADRKYQESQKLHTQEIEKLRENHAEILEKKDQSISQLEQDLREQERKFQEEKTAYEQKLQAEKKKREAVLNEQNSGTNSRKLRQKEDEIAEKNQKISQLQKQLEEKASGKGSDGELSRLKNEKQNAEYEAEKQSKNAEKYQQQKNIFMGVSIGVGVLAAGALIAAIVFGMKSGKVGRLESEKVQIESQNEQLESEKVQLESLMNEKESELERRKAMETEMETESESETQTETEYQTGDETENPEGVQTEEGSLSQGGQETSETTGNSSEDNGDPNYGVDRTGQSPQPNY